MASKTQIQKAQQGYVEKPLPAQCGTCGHYTSDIIPQKSKWIGYADWTEEKNKRCGIGGFAVKKTAVCNLYVPKGEQ